MTATFHQVIESDFGALKGLMDGATEFLESHEVDAQAVFRINLTLEEIVTNIIKFGHADATGHMIDVALKVQSDVVEAVIVDEGHEFNPVLHRMETPSTVLSERTTGGLGIFLIKKLLSSMNYRREGQRNIVEVKAQRKRELGAG
jgi:anti-sigma regulatory factor (Ser/Thr protein kinase)